MANSDTTKKVISNQAYESIQPYTLKDEPVAKSTILFANRYSGVNEVSVTDESLKEILESTLGTAGNNVLVQLKKKFTAFKDGPWYIDSRDGIIHIHNRKYTRGTVHNYTYQRENGELLSASFTIQEIYKPFAGLGAVVNAMDKALTQVGEAITNYELPQADIDLPTRGLADGMYGNTRIENGHVIQPTDTIEKTMWNNGYTNSYWNFLKKKAELEGKWASASWDAKMKRMKYDKKTPAQLKKEKQDRANRAYGNTSKTDQYQLLIHRDPTIDLSYKMYLQYANVPGGEKLAQYYLNEAKQKASKINIPAKNSETYWGEQHIILNTGTQDYYNNGKSLEYFKDQLVKKTVSKWYNRVHNSCRIQSYKVTNVKWNTKGSTVATVVKDENGKPILNPVGYENFQKVSGTIYLTYYGYGQDSVYITGSQLIHDMMPRKIGGPKKGPLNLGGAMDGVKNALHNMGKGAREKQLVATIRVVGNPDLEISQQIGLYNVGKKYSGIWYIKTVTHNLEFGQGYICDIELQRQVTKSSAQGTHTILDTKKSTVDSVKPRVTATVGNKPSDFRKAPAGHTGTNPRSPANTHPSHKQGSDSKLWQDCLDIPWTAEEAAIGDKITDPKEKAKYTNYIALRHYNNKKFPNMPHMKQTYIKVDKKTGKMTAVNNGTFGIFVDKIPKGKYHSRNYSDSMNRNNKNKNKNR